MEIPKEIGALIVIVTMLFLGFIIPVTLTLGNQEIQNEEISFNIFLFSLLLGIGLTGTFSLYFTRYWWKGDNKYGDSFGFFNIGEKPSFQFFKRFTSIQLIFISIIFFSLIFLITNILQVGGLTGSKVLPQQFSPSESLAFSTLLIGTGEEAMNIFVMGCLVFSLIIFAKKFDIKYSDFVAYFFIVIPIIMGIIAVIWHGSAYPSSDIAKGIVFLFWAIKNFLILATGFIFIGLIMHWGNNFFIDYGRLYSSDFVLSSVIFALILISSIYIFIYRKDGNWYKGANR
jgi:hypothetical protein